MPQNLELKARISSVSEATRIARRLKAKARGVLHQRDIYYLVRSGRLKLRIISKRPAELIFYTRPNKRGSRYSDYVLLPVSNSKSTNELFTTLFGQKVVVEKKRRLFLLKNSRIHLDEVRGLGAFIEFEVLVKHGKRQAQKLLEFLTAEFDIKRTATVAVSYSDLIFNSKRTKKE
jgi:predicted adenylyl cyclase CyaB